VFALYKNDPYNNQTINDCIVNYPSMIAGAVPHSLSPYPSEEEETYFRSVPHPGFPTPPRGLRLENRGPAALVLRWQASKILDADGHEVNKPLIGENDQIMKYFYSVSEFR